MIDEFKGSLRGLTDYIMKIRIRNPKGEPQHKSEFRLNDKNSLLRFLGILKDKFGVDCFEIKDKYKKKALEQQKEEMDNEIKNLMEENNKDWREKTRGLRETDEEFREKAKKILSVNFKSRTNL